MRCAGSLIAVNHSAIEIHQGEIVHLFVSGRVDRDPGPVPSESNWAKTVGNDASST